MSAIGVESTGQNVVLLLRTKTRCSPCSLQQTRPLPAPTRLPASRNVLGGDARSAPSGAASTRGAACVERSDGPQVVRQRSHEGCWRVSLGRVPPTSSRSGALGREASAQLLSGHREQASTTTMVVLPYRRFTSDFPIKPRVQAVPCLRIAWGVSPLFPSPLRNRSHKSTAPPFRNSGGGRGCFRNAGAQ